ncbi:CPBP family intramembrane metalloprotease [Ktedonosporobacter rubrisoli]|uniref:CPBP family intramembrane metalloprotease n=1 Tax=Ktedonosporobacter rubrisoli TaxID=2509675 RepID=A0A4P6JLQ4_KTERU|nr:type II CAAX endopeptidase family protein [Ktedonosporobacter rubrisoli]QBD75596.1 CPBP family intramembrane metalloprotease [Ktedonosporobacter rubrisoli]
MYQADNSSIKQADNALRATERRPALFWRLLLFGLGLVGIIVLYIELLTGAQKAQLPQLIPIIQILVYPGLTLGLTYIFRRWLDKRPWRGLGLISPLAGLPSFLQGILLVFVSSAFFLGLLGLAGWVHIVAFQPTPSILIALLVNAVVTFFSEPLLEETAMRGYIYRNLNTRWPCWLAILGQTILFTSWPLASYLITGGLLGQEIPPASYYLTYIPQLLLFGFILQLCRITAGNLWMNMGFHLAYLEVLRFISPEAKALIRIEFTPTLPGLEHFLLGDGRAICLLIVSIVVFFAWQALRRRPINWQAIDPDSKQEQ